MSRFEPIGKGDQTLSPQRHRPANCSPPQPIAARTGDRMRVLYDGATLGRHARARPWHDGRWHQRYVKFYAKSLRDFLHHTCWPRIYSSAVPIL
jgi:hypothetical protein